MLRIMGVQLRSLFFSILSLTLVVGLGACDVGTFGEEPDGGGGGGELPLSFNGPNGEIAGGQIGQDMAACLGCHGAGLQEGNYRVDTYAGITGIGSAEPANVIAGDINSLLLAEMTNPVIAPVEHGGLATPARVQLLTAWINAGAPENAPLAVADAAGL